MRRLDHRAVGIIEDLRKNGIAMKEIAYYLTQLGYRTAQEGPIEYTHLNTFVRKCGLIIAKRGKLDSDTRATATDGGWQREKDRDILQPGLAFTEHRSGVRRV